MATLAEMIAAGNAKRANKPTGLMGALQNAGRVIDQGLLGGRIGQIPQRAAEIQQGLLNIPRDLAQLASPEAAMALNNEMAAPRQANPQQWMDAGLELSGMAPVGGLIGATKGAGLLGVGDNAGMVKKKVYHGTQKDFNGPLLVNKSGSGTEGYGAYLALDRNNAKRFGMVKNFTIPEQSYNNLLHYDLPLSKQPIEIQNAVKHLIVDPLQGKDFDVAFTYTQFSDDFRRKVNNPFASSMVPEIDKKIIKDLGAFNKSADEIRKYFIENPSYRERVFGKSDPNGKEIYDILARRYGNNDRKASEYLNELGISGAKFKSSRDYNATNGNSENLLIWDQQILDDMHKDASI